MKESSMQNKDLFIEGKSIADSYIKKYKYPFEVLPNISDIIMDIGKNLDDNYEKIGDNIWIEKRVKLPAFYTIIGPCIIDSDAEIRPSAFIRGNVIIGKGSVLGNSCEVKNSIIYDNVEVPHFNYVGDSILGYKSHMGAGSITSNLKSTKTNVVINDIETKLRKVGAFLGDYAEVGCNAVLNPGTVVGRNTIIYPLTMVRGVIPENKIVKSMDNIVERR
ncbi:MAG: UDP-N-acetylglucosamine pyrophosphorylase [Bacilli bacterium]|nr:UDP-N-acetylglucosamine pyrophosphorylase [Bacilli bacterium]